MLKPTCAWFLRRARPGVPSGHLERCASCNAYVSAIENVSSLELSLPADLDRRLRSIPQVIPSIPRPRTASLPGGLRDRLALPRRTLVAADDAYLRVSRKHPDGAQRGSLPADSPGGAVGATAAAVPLREDRLAWHRVAAPDRAKRPGKSKVPRRVVLYRLSQSCYKVQNSAMVSGVAAGRPGFRNDGPEWKARFV